LRCRLELVWRKHERERRKGEGVDRTTSQRSRRTQRGRPRPPLFLLCSVLRLSFLLSLALCLVPFSPRQAPLRLDSARPRRPRLNARLRTPFSALLCGTDAHHPPFPPDASLLPLMAGLHGDHGGPGLQPTLSFLEDRNHPHTYVLSLRVCSVVSPTGTNVSALYSSQLHPIVLLAARTSSLFLLFLFDQAASHQPERLPRSLLCQANPPFDSGWQPAASVGWDAPSARAFVPLLETPPPPLPLLLI
jgi:hypothetical protein